MVNVYNNYGEIVGRVRYTQNLDFYDGRNYSCGCTGHHEGLTILRNGNFVLISGSDWQGDSDTAEIITADEALQKVMSSGSLDLLDQPRFSKLKKLYKELLNSEYCEILE